MTNGPAGEPGTRRMTYLGLSIAHGTGGKAHAKWDSPEAGETPSLSTVRQMLSDCKHDNQQDLQSKPVCADHEK